MERLQEIKRKRDLTNRDWQRIILRNIGKSLGWDFDQDTETLSSYFDQETETSSSSALATGPRVLETRQLWFQVHSKMQTSGYGNMLLLIKMEDALEDLMHNRKQKYITKSKYEEMVNKIHLDTEGSVVEPFVALADRKDRVVRERRYYDNLALELEEECLIK
jgi:energy-converting hydrogenase A subunit M